MFLEQYKLEANPFAAKAVRPVFASHSMRYAALKVDELANRNVQALFLSGPAGVGKTTLTRQRLRQIKDLSLAWAKPVYETREALLTDLLETIGPGPVEGAASELRRILEVYLRHQAGNGRFAYLVIDGVERFTAPLLREFEALAQLRLRNRPVLYIVGLTRSEELVANLLPQYDGGTAARATHQRLTGFTLDETRAYARTCLRGAGCEWAEELVPEDVVLDIQAFTQGVVGDINALCAATLDAMAEQSNRGNRQPTMTRALLRDAGGMLNLRYDPSAWAQPVEELSAEAVHFSEPKTFRLDTAKLIVSSGKANGKANGKPVVAEVVLNRPRIVLGRDESCDISLDSRYVSRFQNLFMETAEGWILIDLSSTNGCFVNGRRVREHCLRDGDLIRVGHHQMRFAGPVAKTVRPLAPPAQGDGDSATTLIVRPETLHATAS